MLESRDGQPPADDDAAPPTDDTAFVQATIAKLRTHNEADYHTEQFLSQLAQSRDPRATAFLLAELKDPSCQWRRFAFTYLADTDGQAGVNAVRSARPSKWTMKPWWDRVGLNDLTKNDLLSTRQDAKGRTWILFTSGVLGNLDDLFIARKLPGGWDRPIYTGRRAGVDNGHACAPLDWIVQFPDNPNLLRDSDGDGLTDVVENRLRTNPFRADTDGDGAPDAIDPCPNGPVRKLGDVEKIISACVDARCFGQTWSGPAVIVADGVKPFKLFGYPNTLIWVDATATAKPTYDFDHYQALIFQSWKTGQPMIRFGPDHKTANCTIAYWNGSEGGDGQEMILKKIADDWFVTGYGPEAWEW